MAEFVSASPSDDAPPPPGPLEPAPAPKGRRLSRVATMISLWSACGFVAWQAPALYKEYRELRREWKDSRDAAVIGYIDVNPSPNYASPPDEWLQDLDNETLLWSGWIDGVGHDWFHIGKNDLDRKYLGTPIGRDYVRTIDRTILETSGGTRWNRLQPETPILGLRFGGKETVYPLKVLEKVEVVNDTIGQKPVAVIFTPYVPIEQAIDAYDPVVGGKRLTFGSSGYFYRRQPLLYDRATKSLWMTQGPAMVALTGHYKGTKLKHVAHLTQQPWSEWLAEHPDSLLVVGADRVKVKKKRG